MDGEAWNNPLRCCDGKSDRGADHVVEDGMSGRQGGVSGGVRTKVVGSSGGVRRCVWLVEVSGCRRPGVRPQFCVRGITNAKEAYSAKPSQTTGPRRREAALDPEGVGRSVPDRPNDRGGDQRGGHRLQTGLIEASLNAELTHHLGYAPGAEKPEASANHRNGVTAKTVLTGDGKMRIATPRDRECVREDALSAGCKSPSGLVATQQSKVTALPRGGVGSNRR